MTTNTDLFIKLVQDNPNKTFTRIEIASMFKLYTFEAVSQLIHRAREKGLNFEHSGDGWRLKKLK